MKRMLLAVLLLTLLCSCTNDPSSHRESQPNTPQSSHVPDPDVTTNAADQIAFVRKRYERIEDMARRGVLTCDTVAYTCDDDSGGGTFSYCSIEGELLRAIHEYHTHDQGGSSEAYYFDGPDLFFSLLTESGPEDSTREQRSYYADNQLIDQENLPTLPSGEEIEGTLGVKAVLLIAQTGAYLCK